MNQGDSCIDAVGLEAHGTSPGAVDKVPFGAAFGQGLTIKMGQTHVHKYTRRLLTYIQEGRIDPSFVITHRLPLAEAAQGYATFADDCIKVVLKP